MDLTNKVIYTADAMNQIIELSRNMGEGGTIDWDQIINVPIEIENIINGEIPEYGGIDDLAAAVKANTAAISALQEWESKAKGEISKLQADVLANASAIQRMLVTFQPLTLAKASRTSRLQQTTMLLTLLMSASSKTKQILPPLQTRLIRRLTGLVLAGTYSATTNLITGVKSTAVDPDGKVLFSEDTALSAYSGNAYAGFYFIVDEAGTLQNTGTPARADGEEAFVGDWLVSDGPHWLHFNFSQESTAWGTIGGDITAQEDLQDQFATKLGVNDTISGGTYS